MKRVLLMTLCMTTLFACKEENAPQAEAKKYNITVSESINITSGPMGTSKENALKAASANENIAGKKITIFKTVNGAKQIAWQETKYRYANENADGFNLPLDAQLESGNYSIVVEAYMNALNPKTNSVDKNESTYFWGEAKASALEMYSYAMWKKSDLFLGQQEIKVSESDLELTVDCNRFVGQIKFECNNSFPTGAENIVIETEKVVFRTKYDGSENGKMDRHLILNVKDYNNEAPGFSFTGYGLPDRQFNLTVKVLNKENNVIQSKTIENVFIKKNTITTVKGNLWMGDQPVNPTGSVTISLNQIEWTNQDLIVE